MRHGALARSPCSRSTIRSKADRESGSSSLVQRLLGDAVEIGVIAPEQLDQDRFLGLEMVIEAARQDSRGVGDLLQRGTQTRGGDQRCGGLQNLGAARAVVIGVAGIRSASPGEPHNTFTAPDSLMGWQLNNVWLTLPESAPTLCLPTRRR